MRSIVRLLLLSSLVASSGCAVTGGSGSALPAMPAARVSLRPEYRSCIMLRHVEGRSYEEIAETLDLPLGTVKTYIHRARNELREHLAHVRQ